MKDLFVKQLIHVYEAKAVIVNFNPYVLIVQANSV